jgi:hypothetical protein
MSDTTVNVFQMACVACVRILKTDGLLVQSVERAPWQRPFRAKVTELSDALDCVTQGMMLTDVNLYRVYVIAAVLIDGTSYCQSHIPPTQLVVRRRD